MIQGKQLQFTKKKLTKGMHHITTKDKQINVQSFSLEEYLSLNVGKKD